MFCCCCFFFFFSGCPVGSKLWIILLTAGFYLDWEEVRDLGASNFSCRRHLYWLLVAEWLGTSTKLNVRTHAEPRTNTPRPKIAGPLLAEDLRIKVLLSCCLHVRCDVVDISSLHLDAPSVCTMLESPVPSSPVPPKNSLNLVSPQACFYLPSMRRNTSKHGPGLWT